MALELKVPSHAAVAQSVVRRIGSAEVTGPIPVSSSRFLPHRIRGYNIGASSYAVFAVSICGDADPGKDVI